MEHFKEDKNENSDDEVYKYDKHLGEKLDFNL
jgi:hypothetical protein